MGKGQRVREGVGGGGGAVEDDVGMKGKKVTKEMRGKKAVEGEARKLRRG